VCTRAWIDELWYDSDNEVAMIIMTMIVLNKIIKMMMMMMIKTIIKMMMIIKMIVIKIMMMI